MLCTNVPPIPETNLLKNIITKATLKPQTPSNTLFLIKGRANEAS
jgi:hypothetical protein